MYSLSLFSNELHTGNLKTLIGLSTDIFVLYLSAKNLVFSSHDPKFSITQSVFLVGVIVMNFSHFLLLLIRTTVSILTWHKASKGKGDSRLFKEGPLPL